MSYSSASNHNHPPLPYVTTVNSFVLILPGLFSIHLQIYIYKFIKHYIWSSLNCLFRLFIHISWRFPSTTGIYWVPTQSQVFGYTVISIHKVSTLMESAVWGDRE